MLKLKALLLSTKGVIGIASALTLVVLAESIFPPWAPYFIMYAVLAIFIPLALKTYTFGSFRRVMSSKWKLILGIFVLAVIVDEGMANWLYQRILEGFGVGGNPYYSLNAATEVLANEAARKFAITHDAAMGIYALFIVVWAPIGEELFYRGYMQGMLRQTRSFQYSALLSAAFFGLRHATHLFSSGRMYPGLQRGVGWLVLSYLACS